MPCAPAIDERTLLVEARAQFVDRRRAVRSR
jgi:hypothetical protein